MACESLVVLILAILSFSPVSAFKAYTSGFHRETKLAFSPSVGKICILTSLDRRDRQAFQSKSRDLQLVMTVDQGTLDQKLSEMQSRFPDAAPQELGRFLRKRQGDVHSATAMYSEFRSWATDTIPVSALVPLSFSSVPPSLSTAGLSPDGS